MKKLSIVFVALVSACVGSEDGQPTSNPSDLASSSEYEDSHSPTLSEGEAWITSPIETMVECSVAPISGGCSTPPSAVYGPAPGPYAGYSHSTCSGPPDGRCWDKTIGGTIFKSTLETLDWVPRFNEAFDLPVLSEDGSQWLFPAPTRAYVTAKLEVPNGCRLKWIRLEGFTNPNWVELDYKTRRDIGGAVINGSLQQNWGGWGPFSFQMASSHLVTTPGDTATLEVGTHSGGWTLRRGDYFYNCPGI